MRQSTFLRTVSRILIPIVFDSHKIFTPFLSNSWKFWDNVLLFQICIIDIFGHAVQFQNCSFDSYNCILLILGHHILTYLRSHRDPSAFYIETVALYGLIKLTSDDELTARRKVNRSCACFRLTSRLVYRHRVNVYCLPRVYHNRRRISNSNNMLQRYISRITWKRMWMLIITG